MLARNVDHQVCLHPACMITVLLWTGIHVIRIRVTLVCHIRMSLGHMLLEPTLLNKGTITTDLCAPVTEISGMLLQMIEHCILAIRHFVAMRASKLPCVVATILGLLYYKNHLRILYSHNIIGYGDRIHPKGDQGGRHPINFCGYFITTV